MSTALAIASVTHVLKDLLNNGLIDQNVSGVTGGNVNVTALPPDRIDVSAAGQSQLNIFMYRVTPNTGWSNLGFPTYNAKGERINNQPLALNLHYLLTAYANTELHTEILLGYGMQLLHDFPFLDRDAIKYSLSPVSAASAGGLPDDLRALSNSNLENQPELIKIVQEQINTEEVSKLWAAFQSKYRPSAAYMVSVVLIESNMSSKASLPVDAPQIMSFPYTNIVIDKILSRVDSSSPSIENQKIIAGYQIIVKGKNLFSTQAEVLLSATIILTIDSIDDEELIFTLPSDISAGVKTLKISHKQMLPGNSGEFTTTESNVQPFVLCPRINSVSISALSGAGGDPRSGNLELNITPGIATKQNVVVFLNEYNPAAPSDKLHAYTFDAPLQNESSPPGSLVNSIVVPFSKVHAGTYIIRIQVEGAESIMGDRDPSGYFFKPNVTIN